LAVVVATYAGASRHLSLASLQLNRAIPIQAACVRPLIEAAMGDSFRCSFAVSNIA